MARPKDLKTKIFIDTGDPEETKKAIDILGFLDGQTTNPTLVAKLRSGKDKLSQENALSFYKNHVQEVSRLIPQGSVSIEVYADKNTTSGEMIAQAKNMYKWIPNAHIKLPLIHEGLIAAQRLLAEGMRLNITLCFSQEQAATVFKILTDAQEGQVFISPFIGRLDDKGTNGMDLIKNILAMKEETGSNIEVLTASVRSMDHLFAAIKIGSNIVTSPYKILDEWSQKGLMLPELDFKYNSISLSSIEYETFDFEKDWEEFNIQHKLTDIGLEKFADDWNAMLEQ